MNSKKVKGDLMFSKLFKLLKSFFPPRYVEPVLIDTPEGASLEIAGVINNANSQLITDADMYNDGFLSYREYQLHVTAHTQAANKIIEILKDRANENQ